MSLASKFSTQASPAVLFVSSQRHFSIFQSEISSPAPGIRCSDLQHTVCWSGHVESLKTFAWTLIQYIHYRMCSAVQKQLQVCFNDVVTCVDWTYLYYYWWNHLVLVPQACPCLDIGMSRCDFAHKLSSIYDIGDHSPLTCWILLSS